MKLRHLVPAAHLLCASAQAAQLAVYNFTTATSADSISASSVLTNVTAGLLTDRIDVGLTGAGVSNSGNYFARANFLPDSEALAVSGGSYFDFTITPAAGYEFNLSTITFKLGSSTSQGGSYTTNAFVRSSIGSFTTTIGTPASATTNTNSTIFPTNASIDLGGASFQSISGSITFRVYMFDNSDAVGGAITRIDDLVVNGTVVASAVPEPSSAASLAGAAGLLAGLARRRRRS